jgi:hypothetical protein
VVVRQDDPGDAATARIDGYVVLSGGSSAGLRPRLARLLPDYMLPATLTALPALPLTVNGKLDLARLPPPAAARPTAAPPATDAGSWTDPLSDELLEVWSRIFGFPVRATDDFFELGGNSLLAVRMVAALRDLGMPRLHPRTLYLNPTVRGLADALRPGTGLEENS